MSLLCSAQIQEIENVRGSLITDRLKTHDFGIHYFTTTNIMIYNYIYTACLTMFQGQTLKRSYQTERVMKNDKKSKLL